MSVDDKPTGEPQNFVVVIAYESEDGDIPEEFMQMVEDLKGLYKLQDKPNTRMYAVVEESAKNVLAQVERPR